MCWHRRSLWSNLKKHCCRPGTAIATQHKEASLLVFCCCEREVSPQVGILLTTDSRGSCRYTESYDTSFTFCLSHVRTAVPPVLSSVICCFSVCLFPYIALQSERFRKPVEKLLQDSWGPYPAAASVPAAACDVTSVSGLRRASICVTAKPRMRLLLLNED